MIDTLEFVRRMMESGMAEKTAEQLAHELRHALPEGEAATKADLALLRADLLTELEKLRAEVKTDMAGLRVEFAEQLRDQTRWLTGTFVVIMIVAVILQHFWR